MKFELVYPKVDYSKGMYTTYKPAECLRYRISPLYPIHFVRAMSLAVL